MAASRPSRVTPRSVSTLVPIASGSLKSAEREVIESERRGTLVVGDLPADLDDVARAGGEAAERALHEALLGGLLGDAEGGPDLAPGVPEPSTLVDEMGQQGVGGVRDRGAERGGGAELGECIVARCGRSDGGDEIVEGESGHSSMLP